MTAARLQRYVIFLSGVTYNIKYKGTKQHGNADALSRLPLPDVEDFTDPVDIFYNQHFDNLPITSMEIRRETQRDPLLSQILDFVMHGSFPVSDDINFKPYVYRKSELNVHQGCLLWGNRVIIPVCLRERVLQEIHDGHIGIVKMKALSRTYIWWPKLDYDIEVLCQSCPGCRSVKNMPPASPVHPWRWPSNPWYRLHIDYAGPFKGAMFLIVVDAYSKWPEVFHMQSTTSAATVTVLRSLFARQGIPHELVSDNGPQFCSEEFKVFMKANAIRHITSAPFHPRTNGQAERFVQSFKNAVKASASNNNNVSLNQTINKFLCKYRITPHSTTNESPSMLLYGRNIRTRLDIIKPNVSETVHRKQGEMTKRMNPIVRQFDIGQPVMTRDYRGGQKWSEGHIYSKTGPLSYKVNLGNDILWRRHTDQLRDATDVSFNPQVPPSAPNIQINPQFTSPAKTLNSNTEVSSPTPIKELVETTTPTVNTPPIPTVNTASTRFPQRIRKAPVRLNL